MSTPVRVLLVEDDERDAALVLHVLRKGRLAFEHERVDDAPSMTAALDREGWDVVLCDYSMPRFDAPAALDLVRSRGLDVPFIIVSGSVGEETAVDAMRSGAHDYFLKSTLGPRLNAAIERELREAELRSERRKMQEQLVIADRMALVGTLAAGVAHEINNPLASVMANLELAMRALAARPYADVATEVNEELQDALEAATRLRDIARDLRVFARADEERLLPIDVRKVMESTLRMARNKLRNRARLATSYTPDAFVSGSESKLGQVFLNLVVNAAEAIPEGHLEEHEIRISTEIVGDDVRVEIVDTGMGMPPAIVERLFQPFFTTKPAGEGTGLGLSICHRIVTSYGGRIEVESTPGVGTRFRVTFPSALPADPTGRISLTGPVSRPRNARILVVHADPAILRMVERTLSPAHIVTTATTGKQALTAIEGGARFDSVLCDLSMPEMSGIDFHAAVATIDPSQARRIVFLTEGVFTSRAREFLDASGNGKLEKPFTPTQLVNVVDNCIQREDRK